MLEWTLANFQPSRKEEIRMTQFTPTDRASRNPQISPAMVPTLS